MRYRGTGCELLPPLVEPDNYGKQCFVGRCACGWESSFYSDFESAARQSALSHIRAMECA